MTNKHAELMLYYAKCDSIGCPETRFSLLENRTDPYSVKVKTEGREAVERSLIKDNVLGEEGYRLFIDKDSFQYPRMVEGEDEAKQFILFAKENIKGAQEYLDLIQCIHGKISFFRKMRFEGWSSSEKQTLVDLIEKTPVKLFNSKADLMKEYVLQNYSRTGYSKEEIDKITKQELEKAKFIDHWSQYLDFFETDK